MIGLRDAVILAATKLRTRRIRLAITLIVSGLLFSALVAVSLVGRGMVASIQSFAKDGFAQRFLVSVQLPFHVEYLNDPQFVNRVKQAYQAQLVQEAAKAKQLGLPFDPKTAVKPYYEDPSNPSAVPQLSPSDPLVQRVLSQQAPARPTQTAVTALASKYHASATYTSEPLGLNGPDDQSVGLTAVVNGREVKAARDLTSPTNDGSLSTIGQSLQSITDGLLKPFTLDGANLNLGADGSVPVVAPIDAAEHLLDLAPLPANASAQIKLNRLAEVRRRILNYPLALCYRNAAELDRRQQAEQYLADKQTHAGDKDWTPPPLIYAEPAQPCQPTVVQSDTRTADEKATATAQAQFDAAFRPMDPPMTRTVPLRIVGVTPTSNQSVLQQTSLQSLAQSFFTSTLGTGWFASASAVAQQPLLAGTINTPLAAAMEGSTVYVEFSNRAQQSQFLASHTCNSHEAVEVVACAAQQRYVMSQYGNPLATLYDALPELWRWFRIIMLVVAGLSAVVMMGTIGKIIADSRRETSVFRALGARRFDIAQIYMLYAAMLASLAYGVALVVGSALAWYIHQTYQGNLSAQAALAYNSRDLHKIFSLWRLNLLDLAAIYAFCLIVGVVAASLPLLTNMRRNPINDMREE